MFDLEDVKKLREANEICKKGNWRIAKIAYRAMLEAINQIENLQTYKIRIPWTTGIQVDDFYFTQEELRDK